MYKIVRELTPEEYTLFGDMGLHVVALESPSETTEYICDTCRGRSFWERYRLVDRYPGFKHYYLLEIKDVQSS